MNEKFGNSLQPYGKILAERPDIWFHIWIFSNIFIQSSLFKRSLKQRNGNWEMKEMELSAANGWQSRVSWWGRTGANLEWATKNCDRGTILSLHLNVNVKESTKDGDSTGNNKPTRNWLLCIYISLEWLPLVNSSIRFTFCIPASTCKYNHPKRGLQSYCCVF